MSWPFVELKKIVTAHYGKALKKEDRNENSSAFCVYGSAGQVGFHTEYLLTDKTIVVGRKGSVGKVVWAPSGGWVIDTAYYLTINKDIELDWRYLYYALAMAKLDSKTITTSIPGLNRDDLYSTKIPFPPLAEQKRIAAILDKAEAIRQKRQQAIELADEFLRSVFLDMFGDPVTNPKGWEVIKFEDVGTLDRGKSKHRPRNDPKLLNGKYPLIQTGDVANSGGYLTKYTSTYSDLGLAQSKMWPTGTLCITIAANIAKTSILTFEACFPDSVVGFTANTKVTIEYIQHWLSFLQKMLEETAPESAQKNINLAILRGLDIPVPPIQKQKQFSDVVNKLRNMKDGMNKAEQIHFDMFNSLSQRAFSGEL